MVKALKNYLFLGLMGLSVAASADSPADCPTKSLLNAQTAAGPLRRTQQKFGNCYAHTVVRALDYLNYSAGHSSAKTSILATSIGVNKDRPGDVFDIRKGTIQPTLEYLATNACPETELDLLPGSEGHQRLETARDFLGSTMSEISSQNSSFMAQLDYAFQKNYCANKRISYPAFDFMPFYISDIKNPPSVAAMIRAINERFQTPNPQPIMTALYGMFLKDPYAAEALHRLLIVGQKFEGGKCQYQILNSWGATGAYASPYAEQVDRSTDSLWLPAETLQQKITRMEVLVPK